MVGFLLTIFKAKTGFCSSSVFCELGESKLLILLRKTRLWSQTIK